MKLVRESLITEKKALELSAGLAIIKNGTILLGHPKGQKWYGTYSIPKGHVESGEDLLDAAIRETREEIGISIDPNDIIDPEPSFVDYKDKNGMLYKRVYYFIVNPKEPIPQSAIIPDKEEIDWAGFITKEKAEIRIFWRLKEILSSIDEVTEIEDAEKETEEKPEEKEAEEKPEENTNTEGEEEEISL